MKVLKFLGLGLLVLVLLAAYPAYRLCFGHPFTINQLANRQALEFMADDPELFTSIGIIDGTIFDHHSDKLSDVGVAKRDRDYATLARFIDQVKQFDRGSLDAQEQVTYDILLDFYGSLLGFKRFDWLSSSDGAYAIAPMWGAQVTLPSFLLSQHVVSNDKLARNYVARLRAMGPKLDALTGEMQRQVGLGVVLPVALLDKVEAGIKDTTDPKPADNPLVTSFIERMGKVAALDAARRDALAKDAAQAIGAGVYPAYARMTAALEAIRPKAETQGAGVGRLPDGAAYYALMLKRYTTTDYTPEQVHQLGLDEVARVSGELDALLRSQGRATGSVGERIKALQDDPQFHVAPGDEGRQQLIERYQKILDEVNARMPEYFRTVPAARLLVKRVPVSAEKGSAGAYYEQAAMDGSRPGTFFANLRDPQETATWSMKTLAYHEGIPGHHFQISTGLGLKDLPIIRQQTIYSAYAEGWALYAERFAAEIGMYKDDPFGDVGRLRDELFRAVRLVVDSGLHAKGWSREQAIKYMVDTTGMPSTEVVSEVERYMGLPGQACAYKLGQLKILELRERAKAALGDKFSIKDFHAVVLENGGVPLTLLGSLVDAWIRKTKG